MLGMKAHHESRAQAQAEARGGRRHLLGLRHRHPQGLLAEDVLARPQGRHGLLPVRVGRRRDVDGVDIHREQRVEAVNSAGDALARHRLVHLAVNVVRGYETPVRRA